MELQDGQEFIIGKYNFNAATHQLTCDNNKYRLSTKETQLLKLLVININKIVERSFALEIIWMRDDYFKGRSMDVYISKLRKYLNHDPKIKIVNIHGKGFKLVVE